MSATLYKDIVDIVDVVDVVDIVYIVDIVDVSRDLQAMWRLSQVLFSILQPARIPGLARTCHYDGHD